MAYSTVPFVNSGDAWSAAQHNTYIRDNFAAIWPYTAAGDIAVASSATNIANVATTTNTKILTTVNSNVGWNYRKQITTSASNYSNQSIPQAEWKTIQFSIVEQDDLSMFSLSNPTYFTVKKAGYYLCTGYVQWAANTTATREVKVNNTYMDSLSATSYDVTINTFSYQSYFSIGDTIYVQAYQGSGASLYVSECRLSAIFWGY